jgi:hypothetical protein
MLLFLFSVSYAADMPATLAEPDAKYPAKLKELQKLFWVEAKKYQVEPLDASVAAPGGPAAQHHRGPNGATNERIK